MAHLKNSAIIRDARGVTKRHKKSTRLEAKQRAHNSQVNEGLGVVIDPCRDRHRRQVNKVLARILLLLHVARRGRQ